MPAERRQTFSAARSAPSARPLAGVTTVTTIERKTGPWRWTPRTNRHDIRRIDNYDEWLGRFGTALRTLPDKQRQQSMLPLLDAYRKPEKPLRGAPAPTDVFRAAVQAAKIVADKDIPHLSADLIAKYVFPICDCSACCRRGGG